MRNSGAVDQSGLKQKLQEAREHRASQGVATHLCKLHSCKSLNMGIPHSYSTGGFMPCASDYYAWTVSARVSATAATTLLARSGCTDVPGIFSCDSPQGGSLL